MRTLLTAYTAILLGAILSEVTSDAETYAIARQIEEEKQEEEKLKESFRQMKIQFETREVAEYHSVKQEVTQHKKYLPHHKRGGSKFF